MIKTFNPIKSRRPWPPISISHLFQQGPFSSWPLLFLYLGCFCLDIYKIEMVQCHTARFTFKNFSCTACVTKKLASLLTTHT